MDLERDARRVAPRPRDARPCEPSRRMDRDHASALSVAHLPGKIAKQSPPMDRARDGIAPYPGRDTLTWCLGSLSCWARDVWSPGPGRTSDRHTSIDETYSDR